jgi:hypothetical protein
MAFVFAAYYGLGPAIGHFSAAHDITGKDAWAAALVMMALADVLTRLAVLFVRSRRLAAAPAAVPAARTLCPLRRAPVPMSNLASGPAAGQTVTMRHGWRRRAFAAPPNRPGPARRWPPPTGVDPTRASSPPGGCCAVMVPLAAPSAVKPDELSAERADRRVCRLRSAQASL